MLTKSKYIAINFLCVFVICAGLVTSVHSQVVIDEVIAKVGSENILLSDLEGDFSYRKSLDPSITDEIKCAILNDIISQKVLVYQARLDSIPVTNEEVEARLNYRFDVVLSQMNGDESFFQEYYGATVDEMKERYREDQKEQILAEKMQNNILSEVKITPDEVKQFYAAIPYDSIPYLNAEVELGELVLKPEVNAEQKKIAHDKITDIRNRIINGGEGFSELAIKYSDDFGSGQRGGDLGFAKRGTFVPEFEAVAFTMKEGEISDIVETEFGFHVLQLIERRGNTVRVRHILIKPVITAEDVTLCKEKLDSIRTLIVNDSLTFELAVKKFGLKDMPSYTNNGRIKNQKTGNNFFESADLDPDTYFAIDEMEVGGITSPLEITMPGNEKYFRIVKLLSLNKPHKANLEQDYDKITMAAKENKKQEYYMDWIKDKIKSTYIEVDDRFKNCSEIQSLVE
ncbi:MAG TPA: peptidylprolyl isomerase [Saprospiraceae bacterium]|nr:peptidylprolyl isomerase [Saprospiraceae bacterium]MCB9327724.1 peptidylprolyl isomerase [Lewinellaceae bacterium]HRX28259.1 peptidylprolyl isomerase [Saprospiraceae bacterium]